MAVHEVPVTQDELELAWSRVPVEGRRELHEHAGNEVLERPRVLQPTDVLGLVAGVANQLLRDVARLVVSRIQAAGPDALSTDPIEEDSDVRIEGFATGPLVCALTS